MPGDSARDMSNTSNCNVDLNIRNFLVIESKEIFKRCFITYWYLRQNTDAIKTPTFGTYRKKVKTGNNNATYKSSRPRH